MEFIECGTILRLDKERYLIGWGKRTWNSSFDKESPVNFYFPDYFLSNKKSWFIHEQTSILNYYELVNFLNVNSKKSDFLSWHNPYKEQFYHSFTDLQKLFSNKGLQKAVPYVFEETSIRLNADRLHQSLNHLLNYTKDLPLHVYGFWDDQEGILGASPEILFTVDQKLQTIACAGTISNDKDIHQFINDPKEALEHQIVVDGICEALASYGKVVRGERQILKLPKLSHLITPLEIENPQSIDFMKITEVLHPTPALGAYPKLEGMEWLKTYQLHVPRGRFGAPVGCYMPEINYAKCIVGIRNLQGSESGMRIGAGCGVVPASVVDNEWNELCLKINSIKDMLAL